MSFDQRTFRKALGCFATGVTVVTSISDDGAPVGLTVSSFTSLSLDPALVLVCLDKRSGCLDVFRNAGRFAIHVLRDEQREVSANFASKVTNKWNGVAWEPGVTGAPIIPGCLASFDCSTSQVLDGGDHLIFIGKVENLEFSEAGQPLIYYRGAYAELGYNKIP